MLFHDRGTVNIADVVRYVVTYDSAVDPLNRHTFLSHITSGGHGHRLLHPKLHLRIRNNASMLLRAAYLQGPYALCVSVREDTFHANEQHLGRFDTVAPVYDQDLKASTSFWTELPSEGRYETNITWQTYCRRTWIIEIASQALFALAPITYTITIGYTKESTRKAAQENDVITSSPGLTIQKLTTAELWATPPILPGHTNVHLVILTHGLHSNVTADMLYLKDRIEQTAGLAHRPDGGVVIRGFGGNVCKTERGIKWLGKRMARWLLHETLWLDQVGCFAHDAPPYSRISFIGHSLGGVVQTYAIAMIELMTNGEFFRKLRPVHLITLASPWLGISAESPAYVKLALDVGLIGRTGQDLGLMNRLGQKIEAQPDKKAIRDSRPILRLLALAGSPAHRVIRRFCTRTIYANVVNDGIVPLRTSAMFFLDWNSFDTVEKSIPPNGLITHLGNLSGIVGLPTLDHFIGGVERIFSPRKAESDDSPKKMENERESEESNPKSQSLLPSFLRPKSTILPSSDPRVSRLRTSDHQRRKSMPSMTDRSSNIKKDVADAIKDDLYGGTAAERVTNVTHPQGEGIKQGLHSWDKGHGPNVDEIAKSLTGGSSSSSSESTHAADPSSTQSPSTGTAQPGQPKPTVDIDALLLKDDDNNSENPAESQVPGHIISNQLVESPTETDKQFAPSEGTPHLTKATGPPKSQPQHQAQGDTTSNRLFTLFQHFRPSAGKQPMTRRLSKVYHRSQTVTQSLNDIRPPPPRTTFFENFPSLINPPLPDETFITDPSSRPKTIFHDRIYTPDDIPPVSTQSSESSGNNGTDEQSTKREKLRLEEKIARDWHSDMTWRKVLVKLEPDAHNNIIVRRMFPNAYGWPVIEHLVREHFVHDPEGIHREFSQESGIIPLPPESAKSEGSHVDPPMSPDWESPMSESDEEDLDEESERPGSLGRAALSDEENGEVLEMTDFSADRKRSLSEAGRASIEEEQSRHGDVNKGTPLEVRCT